MALTDILCPPQSWEQFLEQTYFDEEFLRKKANGVTYVRGKHGGFDSQPVLGDLDLFSVGYGIARWVDFGNALGEHQFVVSFADHTGYFYGHTASRPADNTKVGPGDFVAKMGREGTSSVHLHHEYLQRWNDWSSTANAGPRLRQLKEQRGMLSVEDKKWLRSMQEFENGQALLRLSEAIAAQVDDTDDTSAKVVLLELSQAHKRAGNLLVGDSKA